MEKVTKKELVARANEQELRIHRFERLLKKNGLGFDLPELPKTGDFFEIVKHHSEHLPKGRVLEVAKVNHNTNLIKFVGGFNGYFTDFDRSVYLSGAEDEPMKPCAKPKEVEQKLKQLDQSIFDGQDEKWNFAAVDKSGSAFLYVDKPCRASSYWQNKDLSQYERIRNVKFDSGNWQNSLIERDNVELTGSDLCEAMFKRGDNYVMCVTGALRKLVIIDTLQDGKLYSFGTMYENPIPINNQGEPLTASEVGL